MDPMLPDLRAALPLLLPRVITWAEARSKEASLTGNPLDSQTAWIARKVGVLCPELIRVAIVDQLPVPQDPVLKAAAIQTGLLGPGATGLTLGYSVFVCRGHESIRLLSHEFRHVQQYETNGLIAGFLPLYLEQVLEYGYWSAPLEADARAHEQDD